MLTRPSWCLRDDSLHLLKSLQFKPLERIVTSPSNLIADPALQNEPLNINEEASLKYWVSALDCSELELRVAVAEVGPAAKDVSNELGRSL